MWKIDWWRVFKFTVRECSWMLRGRDDFGRMQKGRIESNIIKASLRTETSKMFKYKVRPSSYSNFQSLKLQTKIEMISNRMCASSSVIWVERSAQSVLQWNFRGMSLQHFVELFFLLSRIASNLRNAFLITGITGKMFLPIIDAIELNCLLNLIWHFERSIHYWLATKKFPTIRVLP